MKRFVKSATPLLFTESQEEFDFLVTAMLEYIKPEEHYCRNPSQRCHRCDLAQHAASAVSNRDDQYQLPPCACENLLDDELSEFNEIIAGKYADEWFKTNAGREEVMKILRRFNLDETSIEAEAIKLLGSELEDLDRLLSSAEVPQ